jgi:hypothetical protein
MKKVENVDQEEDEQLTWKAQVFWSHRTWTATIIEQIPDKRIVWRSEGDKGHVDGAVTFHELAPELTRILLVLEYHPQGLFERTGNLWRAQGRRARLELKHFRRHVMTRTILDPGEAEGWRGEIRDGEVVAEPGEQDEGRPAADGEPGAEDEQAAQDAYDGEEPGEDYDEEPAAQHGADGDPSDYEDEPADLEDEPADREDEPADLEDEPADYEDEPADLEDEYDEPADAGELPGTGGEEGPADEDAPVHKGSRRRQRVTAEGR